MTVNKERVRLLVDALRSGDFQQGQNMLRTPDDKYCCLGVACEVARLNGIGIEWQEKSDCETCQQLNWRFDGTGEALGRNVADWYGFDVNDRFSIDVKIGTGVDLRTITMIRANDDLGWDFQKIADALEDQYLREEDQP